MTTPLAGLTVVEVSSFVAAPLCGMTLSQLGAKVIRVDPIGGASDTHRWPVTEDGTSIYWTGLNKGKLSATVDLRSPDGQELVQRLIVEGDGVVVTNAAGLSWLSYDTLVAKRPDLIHLQVIGRHDGSTGVDYTVNAAIGFPLVTGPANHAGPINHVLPAWDVCCGLYAALAVVAALRRRDQSGVGAQISLALEDVALATAGNLGLLTEPQVNGTQRERMGNAIYGQYGQDFMSRDGVAFMVVTLTKRHFQDLVEVSGTAAAVSALADSLSADFTDEGVRYRYREVLSGLFASGSPITPPTRSARRCRPPAYCSSAIRASHRPPRVNGLPQTRCSPGCTKTAWGSTSRPGCRPFSTTNISPVSLHPDWAAIPPTC